MHTYINTKVEASYSCHKTSQRPGHWLCPVVYCSDWFIIIR